MSTPLGSEPSLDLEWITNLVAFGISEGTWRTANIEGFGECSVVSSDGKPVAFTRTPKRTEGECAANAHFIAECRQIVPKLIVEIRRLRSALEPSASPTHTEATPEPQKGS